MILAVSDTGVGISPEVRSRIFEPFFTTKPAGHGTGLGLSTVYAIVKKVHGHVWFYSELGQGTTFKIYLPRVNKPVEMIRRDKTPVRTTANVATILLVEDEERLQRSIRQMLEKAGYIVLPASHGIEALRILEEHDGRIDLVLTDIGLPHIRGPELVERLKTRLPNIAVLYMSGFGEDGLRPDEASELSGRFIQKPFRKDTSSAKAGAHASPRILSSSVPALVFALSLRGRRCNSDQHTGIEIRDNVGHFRSLKSRPGHAGSSRGGKHHRSVSPHCGCQRNGRIQFGRLAEIRRTCLLSAFFMASGAALALEHSPSASGIATLKEIGFRKEKCDQVGHPFGIELRKLRAARFLMAAPCRACIRSAHRPHEFRVIPHCRNVTRHGLRSAALEQVDLLTCARSERVARFAGSFEHKPSLFGFSHAERGETWSAGQEDCEDRSSGRPHPDLKAWEVRNPCRASLRSCSDE